MRGEETVKAAQGEPSERRKTLRSCVIFHSLNSFIFPLASFPRFLGGFFFRFFLCFFTSQMSLSVRTRGKI